MKKRRRTYMNDFIVNEYPTSGGSWLLQMLPASLGLPFPRNRLRMLLSYLMQCHVVNPVGIRKVVVVWRDGHDVAVSFYHHLLIVHDYGGDSPAK